MDHVIIPATLGDKQKAYNKNFLGDECVLLFPPVNNYRRFVIHQICEEISSELSHFSLGHGDRRRTVVCFKTDLIECVPENAMGIDHNYIASSEPNHEKIEKIEKRGKIMPAVGIYRPPAARRLGSQDAVVVSSPIEKPKSKQRRPDIQVYVPRAKRSSAVGSADVTTTSPAVPVAAAPNRRNSLNTTPRGQHKKLAKLTVDQSNNECTPGSDSDQQDSSVPTILDLTENAITNSSTLSDIDHSLTVIDGSNNSSLPALNLELVPDLDVPTTEDSNMGSSSKSLNSPNKENMDFGASSNVPLIATNLPTDDLNYKSCDIEEHGESIICDESIIRDDSIVSCVLDEVEISELDSDNQISNISANINTGSVDSYETVSKTSSEIEQLDSESDTKKSSVVSEDPNYFITIGSETREERRVDDTSLQVGILLKDERIPKLDDDDNRCINREEQNRKNRSIHRGNINYMSDLLVISDTEISCDSAVPHLDVNQQGSESVSKQNIALKDDVIILDKVCEDLSSISALRLNPDECTWDMMFDENGDCLDPLLMDELTSKVGSVTIKSPRSDYKNYSTREFQPRDEYSHVVEIYNFPAAFKTKDLFTIFSPYSSGGFEIKWVDDTHCLGVFTSPVVAAEVLETNLPFCKTRPLCEATAESKAKARRSSEFLQPYRARPETCPALARRLVTGALGVRLSTARQEREAEKALLKVARDKKRLEARQKDEAWEGTLVGTSTNAD